MDHAHTPSHPSSSHAAHSAALPQGNTNELNPNPGMYMGMPWSQPAYAPQHYLPYPSQHYLPQPDNVSAGQKRVAEDLGDDKASKKSKLPKKISKDPEFVQLPDENGRRVIKCLRCDEKMNSTSYGKHIQTLKHRGLTEGEFICGCGHPYSRIDALERHWKDSPCGKKRKMCKRPSSSIPSQGSTSSASASPAAFPTAPFTFHAPAADVSMSSGLMTSNVAEYVHISPQVTQSQETTTPADHLLSAPVESVDPVVTALFTGWALTELENVQLPPQANEVPSSQEMDVLTDPLWAGGSPDQVAEFMQYYNALISQELPQN